MFWRFGGRACVVALAWLAVPGAAIGGQTVSSGTAALLPIDVPARPAVPLDGPPAPIAPAVVNRDERGHATMRAFRISTPLKIDGRLDEEVYSRIQGATDFIQQLPRENAPATERTLVWIFFDDTNLYLAAHLFDSEPEREIATEMRRDDNNILQNESISFILDTFYDKRNAFFFQTTPLGALRDQAIANEQVSPSWNTVWDVKSARDDSGWTTELVIPFKSLRYSGSGEQVWGLNIRRIIEWKNEADYLSAVPAAYGMGGVQRMLGAGGTLVGVETPLQSLNLELKPYVVSSLNTDLGAKTPYTNDLAKSAGLDFKYGLTRGLVLDATMNTDFAQVEEDTQQVNLTRFSLFFPEKRDFFLEGQGIFQFGGAAIGERGGGGTVPEVPILFFSRQIGLSRGQAVPVRAGARVTGRAGKYSIGAINIQTGDKIEADATATNFSVLRLKRDVFRRSTIGVLATRRAPSAAGASNYAGGIDASLAFFQSVNFIGYYAKTATSGVHANDTSYRGRFDYGGDAFGLQVEHTMVGEQFTPEVGYVRRSDFRRSYAEVRVSHRTRRNPIVRRISVASSVDYIENAARTLVQEREVRTNVNLEFHNSDTFRMDYQANYELIPKDFGIARGVFVPKGGYDYGSFNSSYSFGQQHFFSGQINMSAGSFYEGSRRSLGFNNGYVTLNRRIAFEPGFSMNWVSLPWGDFTNNLITNRTIITPTPRMLIGSLMQFNAVAHSLSTSVRLNWEYRPGSQLFVVYSDGRETGNAGFPVLLNRSFAVKLTRLVRF